MDSGLLLLWSVVLLGFALMLAALEWAQKRYPDFNDMIEGNPPYHVFSKFHYRLIVRFWIAIVYCAILGVMYMLFEAIEWVTG